MWCGNCSSTWLVLYGNEIVDTLLLRPVEGGECRTSPMPEEEATLLGDIKSNIKPDVKHEIELPQVPEKLEIQEQVQPAE